MGMGLERVDGVPFRFRAGFTCVNGDTCTVQKRSKLCMASATLRLSELNIDCSNDTPVEVEASDALRRVGGSAYA